VIHIKVDTEGFRVHLYLATGDRNSIGNNWPVQRKRKRNIAPSNLILKNLDKKKMKTAWLVTVCGLFAC